MTDRIDSPPPGITPKPPAITFENKEVILVGPNDWAVLAVKSALVFWAILFSFIAIFSLGISSAIFLVYLPLLFSVSKEEYRYTPHKRANFRKRFGNTCEFVLHVETPLMKGAFLAFLGSITILLSELFCVGLEIPFSFPGWFLTDAAIGTIGFLLFWFKSTCWYRISPQSNVISYIYKNVFFQEKRKILFKEVFGVGATGRQQIFSLKRSKLVFEPFILFSDGFSLPIPSMATILNPTPAAIHDFFKPVQVLGKILQCPVFSPTPDDRRNFRLKKKEIDEVAGKAKNPQGVRDSLLEAELSRMTLGHLGENRVKVEFTTQIEAILFWIVVGLMMGTLVYALFHEWKYLAANPRFFYLILLDCTSVFAAITGVWRWLIDEYYFLDCEKEEIRFFSRFLFFKREWKVCSFSDVSGFFWKPHGEKRISAVFFGKIRGREVRLSDWESGANPMARAEGLAAILEKPCTDLGIFGFDMEGKALPKETADSGLFTNFLGMKFKRIFKGAFKMGSDQQGESPAFPAHRVVISKDYFIGIHEVTQAQYEMVMGSNPSELLDEEAPVDTVPWQAAKEFCNRLSVIEKRSYRLPTEAEWEYASRAGTTRDGFLSETETTEDYAWGSANSCNQSQPVGRLKPNPWGLYDMIGNVKEWCEDFFGPYDADEKTDPKGPPAGEFKVIRGGSFKNQLVIFNREYTIPNYDACWSNSRSYAPPDFWAPDLGFRVVLDIPSTAEIK